MTDQESSPQNSQEVTSLTIVSNSDTAQSEEKSASDDGAAMSRATDPLVSDADADDADADADADDDVAADLCALGDDADGGDDVHDRFELAVDSDGVRRIRRKKTMTAKQFAANRANAKKSSGPRTAAGKEASSRNATRHGGYIGTVYGAVAGRFRENPDRIANNYLAVAAAFQPKDALEFALAERVASDVISLGRLDRYEADTIESISAHSSIQYTPGADPYVRRMAWQVSTALEEPDIELDATWKELAIFVRSQCWRKDAYPTITDLWTSEIEPNTPEGWKSAFHLLVNAAFKDDTAAAIVRFDALERHHESAIGRLESQEKYEKADRLVAALSRLQAVRSRRTRDLAMALSAIRMGRTPIKGADET